MIKKKYKRVLTLVATTRLRQYFGLFMSVITTINTLTAQPTSDFFQSRLEQYIVSKRPEKTYLHLDKPHYGNTETIWFKAYTTDAVFHQGYILSNVLYVELVDSDHQIKVTKTLKLTKGLANGNIDLDGSLASGNYEIRAYTNWQKNFSPEFIFSKTVQIVNLDDRDSHAGKNDDSKDFVELHFFPEGGNLIHGITTKVAVKATNKNGEAVKITGRIFSKEDQVITRFSTNDLGTGILFLTPDISTEYWAILHRSVTPIHLPYVKPSGYNLRLIHEYDGEKLTAIISSKDATLKNGLMIIHQRGKLIATYSTQNADSMAIIKMDKKLLPPGVCHFSFFDQNNQPQTERLVFANLPDTSKKIKLTSDKHHYSKRDLLELTVQMEPAMENASISIAVTPSVESRYSGNEENIVTYYLLQSDLRGRILSPGYYFKSDKEAYSSRDMLMLTQGWRRFKWDDVLNSSAYTPHYFPESGLSIRGHLTDLIEETKPRVGTVTQFVYTNELYTQTCETDSNGYFVFTGYQFTDTTEVLLKAVSAKGRKDKEDEKLTIVLDDQIGPPFVNNLGPYRPPNDDFISKLLNLRNIALAFGLDENTKLLDEIVVSASRKSDEPFDRPGQLYNTPTFRIIADSSPYFASARTPFDLLYGVPGVRVFDDLNGQSVTVKNSTLFNEQTPLYLLDGVPTEADIITTVLAQDVEFIDVLQGVDAFAYGSTANGGAIAIYTKYGRRADQIMKKGVLGIKHPGYSQSREFYSPNYSITKEEHAVPDYRTTLYWNPEIKMESGKGNIKFFTSDQEGPLNIRLEGITKDGQPIFRTLEVIVTK